MAALSDPLDLVKFCLDEQVIVKMKGERKLKGKLHAYDQHLNLVLGDVQETKMCLDRVEEESLEENTVLEWKQIENQRGMLFVRGDSIIIISPVNKIV